MTDGTTTPEFQGDEASSFLAGGGEMGARMRTHDWASSPLGLPESWTQSLRTLVSLMLNSRFPMFAAWGDELGFLYNDAYAEILGTKHPAALGARFEDVWSDIWSDIHPMVEAALNGEGSYFKNLPLTMNRRGFDEQTWFTFSYSPVRDESGRVGGMYCACTETTDTVLAEAGLLAERRRQQRLFEQAPGFITILGGPDLRFEFVNNAYRRLFGTRDYIGRTVREVFPDLAGQGFYELVESTFASGERYIANGIQIWLQSTPEGPFEERFLNFIYEPVTDQDGEITGLFVEGYDVTDTHRAQVALKEESRTLETLNSIGAALAAELALETVVQMVTDAGVELTGARFGAYFHNIMDETGERLHLFTLSGAERADFEAMGRPRATAIFGPTFRNEGVLRSDDILADSRYGHNAPHKGMPEGHLPVRSYLAIPVVSRSGEVLGGLIFGHPEPNRFSERHERLMVNIASQAAIAVDNARLFEAVQHSNEHLEQRVAERSAELEAAHDALRQSQKMEAVGQLTGGLAHDFNNLLAGISGSLEMMAARIAQGRFADVDRYLLAAQGAAKRAAALTHRLLAFSRRQTLEPKPTDVNRLVSGMDDLIRRTVGPQITMDTVEKAGVWPVLVDPNQLENALLNLCINARDAMPDGGKLTIETGNRWLDERAGRERDLPPGQYVSLCVSDNGCGMSNDVIERAFDPFFTTKPIGVGTGLGLSMIYGFARQSGGQVRIYSEVGQGTMVCIYLPRHFVGEEEAEVHTADPAVHQAKSGQTVLVIDDEALVRMLIVDVLEDLGYSVLEAGDGPEALKYLRSSTKIDLLITDVGLPNGMNGRQVADAARVLRPDLKVLFVTGYAENAVLGHGHLDPGMKVVTKPFDMGVLASRIKGMTAVG